MYIIIISIDTYMIMNAHIRKLVLKYKYYFESIYT